MKTVFTIAIATIWMGAFAGPSKAQAEGPAANAAAEDAGAVRAATAGGTVEDCNGPTVFLHYRNDTLEKNPIRSFMYFVPLVTPVAVSRQISAENRQQVGIISSEKKITSRSFSATCEFEMSGSGFCRYTFDPAGMVTLVIAESKKTKRETLTNLLDYIHFEGEGFGRIHIKGTIASDTPARRAAAPRAEDEAAEFIVTEVELEFNERGRKSPVTIGLYDLKPKEGQYRYENRSHQTVARVNSLVFKRCEDPRMGITVASLAREGGPNGLLEHLKGAIANLFIRPVKIDPLGNETLLNFGLALFEQQPTFTFPRAGNMKEIPILAAAPQGEEEPLAK